MCPSDLQEELTEHAYVNVLTRGDLSSLRWISSPLRHFCSGDSNVRLCRVSYSSLNFRDVMLATGKLPADALPGPHRPPPSLWLPGLPGLPSVAAKLTSVPLTLTRRPGAAAVHSGYGVLRVGSHGEARDGAPAGQGSRHKRGCRQTLPLGRSPQLVRVCSHSLF